LGAATGALRRRSQIRALELPGSVRRA